MRRAEKVLRIQAILDELYPEVPIPLDHQDAFTLLVAVVLSAQTTDKKVNEVTPALFAEAPTPERMAALGRERILTLIRQLGLAPQKAKALEGLSRLLLERHGGQVPRTYDELEALPGVGHKTASVVMAQAFGEPAFPVDTHIHRLAARWGLSDGRSVERTERDLKRAFARERWNDLHLQIIYFGREHCPALYHDLTRCPICSWAASKKRIRDEQKADRARRVRA
jgi:endonuclease-3